MRRSKRLRQDAAVEQEAPQAGPSPLERLPRDVFNSLLCPLLDVPDLVAVMRLNKFMRQRVHAAGFAARKRQFAAEERGWTYANMNDDTALGRIAALVAKGENCLACGVRCKGVHWPAAWRDGRFNLCSHMCMDCFKKRNPRVKLHKAAVADSKFGLSPALREGLPYVEWNRGFQSRRRMYVESDLLEAAAKKKKTSKK
jgi:hypothetical protein